MTRVRVDVVIGWVVVVVLLVMLCLLVLGIVVGAVQLVHWITG